MNRGKLVFAQLMQHLPLTTFRRCVTRYRGAFKVKSFSCLDQFLCMAFAQLTFRESLRDIEVCLRAQSSKLYHLGIRSAVARNTLANANAVRDWRIYADFAQSLIGIARPLYAQESFGVDLQETVYALDTTTIDLCLSVFPWAVFRRAKAAIKLHTLLDLRGNIPTFIHISDGKVHEVNVLDQLLPEPGAFYIMDRGFLDFERLYRFHEAGSFFVTRGKSNLKVQRRYSHPVDRTTGLICDQSVVLTGFYSQQGFEAPLRRIRFMDPKPPRRLIFLTNNFALGGTYHRSNLQVPLAGGTVLRELDMVHSFGCHGISRINCAESTVGGVAGWFRSATHRSTSALRRIQGAPTHACVARNCFSRISRKTVVGVTPRTAAASLTDISPRACRSPSR